MAAYTTTKQTQAEMLLSGSIGPLDPYDVKAADLVIIPCDTTGMTIGLVISSAISDHMPYNWIRVLHFTGEVFGYFSEDVAYLRSLND